MIGSLRGKLIENNGTYVLVETAGVGYKVFISSDTAASFFPKDEQEVFLYIHTVVRDDVFDLYGFETSDELGFFQQLINISGVGPKSGLGILSIAPIHTLRSAIAAGDTSYLTKVTGIGKKSAGKIVLELQDKLAEELKLEEQNIHAHTEDSQVMEALLSLGYSQKDARTAVQNIDPEIAGLQARIRAALKGLQN